MTRSWLPLPRTVTTGSDQMPANPLCPSPSAGRHHWQWSRRPTGALPAPTDAGRTASCATGSAAGHRVLLIAIRGPPSLAVVTTAPSCPHRRTRFARQFGDQRAQRRKANRMMTISTTMPIRTGTTTVAREARRSTLTTEPPRRAPRPPKGSRAIAARAQARPRPPRAAFARPRAARPAPGAGAGHRRARSAGDGGAP